MTPAEFENEFRVKYNMASMGAPDLNSYEISLFLTQGIRDIIKELYPQFENKEFVKRALAPLIITREYCIDTSTDDPFSSGVAISADQPEMFLTTDYYKNGLLVHEIIPPTNLWWIIQDQVDFLNPECNTIDVEVVAEDIDNLNKSVKNPFKKPNKRKVYRVSDNLGRINLIAHDQIECYKMKYLKKYTPIIVANFEDETDLVGNETIDGLNTISNTELPVFLHDDIVDRGVVLAIRALRDNNLRTQIEV